MGVFSNKLKSLIFDKDPLGIIKKTKEIASGPAQKAREIANMPAQAMKERSPAWQAGVAAAKKSRATQSTWTISRGEGPKAMAVPKVVQTPASKPRAVAAPVSRSRKTFSTAKAKTKIPHYDKIPGFAKNYIRVPARTFIRDLSDTNLNRTFGPATTGTPKAKDTVSIAQSAPKPSVINSPQPEVKSQMAKSGSSFSTPAAIATGAVLGLGTAAGIAIAGKEPRSQYGRRKPTDRRQGNVPHPFGEEVGAASEQRAGTRRAIGSTRRDPEREITGTKSMRGKFSTPATINGEYARSAYGEQGKKDYSGFRAANAANEEKRLKDLGGTRRAGDPKPRIKPKLRKAGTPAPVAEAPKVETPKVAPAVRHGIRGNFKGPDTATAAINALPDKPKPRLRRAGTSTAAPAPTKSLEPTPRPAPTVVESGGVAQTPEVKIKANEARMAAIQKALDAKKNAPAVAPAARTKMLPESPEEKIKANNAKIAKLEKQIAAKKSAGVVSGSSSTAAPAPKPSARIQEIAKLTIAQEKDAKKTYRFRGQPFPKNRGTADRVRETPATVDSINEDPTKGVRKVRRQKEMAKGETTVGTSQSLTQGIKAVENKDRNRQIEKFIRRKGVTKLPPATKEMMEPEQPHVQTGPAKQFGYHKGRLPQKKETIVNAKPISTREELLAQLEKASKENQSLGGKGAKISTTGGIVAAGSPRIQVRQSKAAKAKAAMESKPPEVVRKTTLRKAGTPPIGATAEAAAVNPAPKSFKGRLPKGKLGGKLGIAALAGIGAGAFMSGSEAKASTGSLMAGAKAAGKSIWESGREYAKFATGAAIASRMPGVIGGAARFGIGKAIPALMAVGPATAAYQTIKAGGTLGQSAKAAGREFYDESGASTIVEAGQAGMGVFRAKRAAEKEAKGSAAKYGTVALATATRHAREKAKGLRK